jgi:hypothetical protein
MSNTLTRESSQVFGKSLLLNLRRVELGDVLLLLYVAAFVRQYAWLVANNGVAWTLTVVLSVLVWYLLLTTKRIEKERSKLFWLIVALPLLLVYAMRVAFPDGSFDQLNYHLLSAERGLRGVPFTAADFFPAPFQFNPASEMVTGIARYLLGYRVGTIVNYLAMLWAGSILYRFLGAYSNKDWLRCLGVLLILLTEQPLFEINNYMVDLLAVPLLLEATLVILNTGKIVDRRDLLRVAFFLGASLALKLTNTVVVLPLILVYAYKLSAHRRALTIKDSASFVVTFLAPLVPFSVFIYRQTGSPVFPFYNKIFRSPFWPPINWTDVRWGPKTLWEGLVWPVVIAFKPERTSELAVYSGRLSLIFAAVILCLFLRPPARVRTLCVIILLGLILWTLSSGYVRYAMYLELLGGVVVLTIGCNLTRFKGGLRRALIAVPWIILLAQSFVACRYVYRYEWSMRPTVFHNPGAFLTESEYLFRDRSFMKFVPEREQKLFADVDVWVESNFITNGVETLLQPNAPIILVCFPYYFETLAGLDKFSKVVNNAAGKKIYTLAFTKDLSPSLDMLSFRGLEMGKFTAMSIPFYSPDNRFDMVLIEILPPGKGLRREFIKTTQATAPLPASGFNARLSATESPAVLKTGERVAIYVRIKNTSDSNWQALGRADGAFAIKLGNHWFNEQGVMVVQDDARASLLFDLQPGQEMELPITVTAPTAPGRYYLELDMVQELVAWFGSQRSKTMRLEVMVER